ncbi:MAG: hypothetical protein QM533_02290 [Cytophagales bacterium]|nr:hypothetical protein [Cytophagales bacterium]
MSFKKIVIALLVINLGYFVYSQGWLNHALGIDNAQREPERALRQINPTAIAVATMPKPPAPIEAAPTQTAPKIPTTKACVGKREQWLVYMGPYATEADSNKKKAQLNALGVLSTPVSKPSFKRGFSLGEFESKALAQAALAKLAQKGVKTANVVFWATVDCPPN